MKSLNSCKNCFSPLLVPSFASSLNSCLCSSGCLQASQPCLVWVIWPRTGLKGQGGGLGQLGGHLALQQVRRAAGEGPGLSLPSRAPSPPTPPIFLHTHPQWGAALAAPCSVLCVCLITGINVATNNATGWVLICQTQCVAVIPNTLTFSHEIISIFSD